MNLKTAVTIAVCLIALVVFSAAINAIVGYFWGIILLGN